MQITTMHLKDGVVSSTVEEPTLEPLAIYNGQAIVGFRLAARDLEGARVEMVEMEAGGGFVMHSSPYLTLCQIVSGRGKLGLPDGRDLSFDGPELYVFERDTLHSWHSIQQATVLSVVVVGAA